MSAAVLKRRSLKDPKRMPFVGDLAVLRGRVHEFCGPARVTSAMLLAQASEGPLLWIAPAFAQEKLNAQGVRAFIDPGRLVFVQPERAPDLLWSMEEVLRSGVVDLVVVDLPAPPALTPVRRQTLAAEAGGALTGHPPTGVMLTPGMGGAPGVETRWHLAPRHKGEAKSWHLERLRARLEPPRAWTLTTNEGGFHTQNAPIRAD